MKQLFTTFCVVLMATCMAAAPIDKEKALLSAKTFMSQHGLKDPSRMAFVYQGRPMRAKANGTSSQHAPYFIFNNGGDNGFVIVSGDDRTPSILGYSDKGAFNTEDIPTNMAAWLAGYADQIAYLDSAGIEPPQGAVHKAPTMRAVSPLLTSRWTQDEPFCDQLPTVGNYQVPVGCGATAMAQVMYYHKWPAATAAEIPGYKNDTQYVNYDEMYLDTIPANQKFDWDNMLDVYTGNETEAQKAAVAFLSRCCGVAVHMDYGIFGSGSYLSDFPQAMTTYFNYDSNICCKSRDNFSYNDWNQMLYADLSAGRPVIYGGQSTGGGHAFVIDGYDGENLYHVNWGWNNGTDGFFLLSVLDPGDNSGTGASTTNTGFNSSQQAIFGIQPQADSSTPIPPPPGQLTFSIDEVEDGYVSGTYRNETGRDDYYFKYALGYYNEAGELVKCSYEYGTSISPGWYSFFNLKVNISTPGHYTIFPMSKVSSSNEWIPSPHDVKYVECIVEANGTITLIQHPKVAIEATFTYSTPRYKDMPVIVAITIKNTGEEFNGNLYFTVSKDDKKSTSSFPIQLLPENTTMAEMSFVPDTTGKYNITLSSDKNGNNVIATSSVKVTTGSFISDKVLTATLDVANSQNKIIYGNQLKGTYTITNPSSSVWSGDLSIWIFQNTSSTGTFTSVYSSNFSEVVKAGESKDISFSYRGEYGDYYLIYLTYDNLGTTINRTSGYHLLQGYVGYKADGTLVGSRASGDITIGDDIVAVDLSGVTENNITSITPNSNPNTLYYFSEGSTLTNKLASSVNNIVLGNTAASITLTDQKDFYVPITFTATKISYSRKAPSSTTGDRWETIALPFAVSSIKRGSRTLDFHNDKDFKLKEFFEYEGKDMYFGTPNKMEANVPYLIGFPTALQKKTIYFEGANAKLLANSKIGSSSTYFSLLGTMTSVTKKQIYTLSSDGQTFNLKSKATILPFRAYVNAKFNLNLPSSIPVLYKEQSLVGDVNGDGSVNVTDITILVQYVLNDDATYIVLANADINKDGFFNVTDISLLVDIVLGKD